MITDGATLRFRGLAVREKMLSALRLGANVLREIFDESAYARFLARHQLPRSRESYAAFRREHESAKAVRPRCC